MKAIVYDAPRSYAYRDVPTPEPAAGELRIRVELTGICGTDLHIHEGNFSAEFPLMPGHELVGTVDAIGNGVTGFNLGQRVSVNPNEHCGLCAYCTRGQALMCTSLKGMGTNWAGSFAEFLVAPARPVLRRRRPRIRKSQCSLNPLVARHMAWRRSAPFRALMRLSSALVRRAFCWPSSSVVAAPAEMTVAASSGFKLDRARSLGIDRTLLMDRSDLDGSVAALEVLSPGGFDVVVDATGAAEVSERCVPLARRRGTVMFYGVTGPDDFRPRLTLRHLPARDHYQGLIRRDLFVPRRDPGTPNRPGADRRTHHASLRARRLRQGSLGARKRPHGTQDRPRT